MVPNSKAFEEIHAVWLAYGLLSDKALELIDEAEKFKDMGKIFRDFSVISGL